MTPHYGRIAPVTASQQAIEETTAKTVAYHYDNSSDRTKLEYPDEDWGHALISD